MTQGAITLLDTDTLSAIMRNDPNALSNARDCLKIHGRFSFSALTRYEILRGLKAKRATAQQAAFEDLCNANRVLPLIDSVILRAADVYADLYRRGELIGDADILIAATALAADCSLATNNGRHFSRITDLKTENWLHQSKGDTT